MSQGFDCHKQVPHNCNSSHDYASTPTTAQAQANRLRRWCFWKDNPCKPGRADANCAPCEAADLLLQQQKRAEAVLSFCEQQKSFTTISRTHVKELLEAE